MKGPSLVAAFGMHLKYVHDMITMKTYLFLFWIVGTDDIYPSFPFHNCASVTHEFY